MFLRLIKLFGSPFFSLFERLEFKIRTMIHEEKGQLKVLVLKDLVLKKKEKKKKG